MKNFTIKILFLFICLSYSYAIAQIKNNDSLKKVLQTQKEDTNKVNTLNALSDALLLSDDKNKIAYAKEALSLAEKINFKKGEAFAYLNIAQVYYYQSNYPEAIKYGAISLKLYEELKDKRGRALVYQILTNAYGMEGNYSENLKNAYAALNLFEELGDKKNTAIGLSNLSIIYSSHDNHAEGLKHALLAEKIYMEIDDKWGIATSLAMIGAEFLEQGNYPAALQRELTAIKLFEELGNRGDRGYVYCYEVIGSIYEKQGELAHNAGDEVTALNKFSGAQINYLKLLKSNKNNGYKDGIATAYINLGNINIKLKNLPIAKEYLQNSLLFSKEVGFKDAIRDGYSSLANLDSIIGNYKEAYDNYKMYILYRDSILNEESKKSTLQTKMQYEFDKKEAVVKAKQDKENMEGKRVKNLQYFAIATLIILVLIILLVAFIQWRNNKQKQKANAILQKQKLQVEGTLIELKSTQAQLIQSEKMASLGELTAGIAHEIQNPLNFVNNFSEVNTDLIVEACQEIDKGNISEAKTILNDIKKNEEKINHHGKRAGAIVKGMLQHSRSSNGVKEPADINTLAGEYLRLSYHGMKAKDKSFNAALQTDFDETIGEIPIVGRDIGRVLLNLSNNAFYSVTEKKKQHSDGYDPLVSVSTTNLNDKIEIRVKDNGLGIPQNVIDKIYQPFFTTKPTGQGTGLGLSSSYDIITKEHGGTIKVESKPGEGAEFIIQLPLTV